MIERNKQCQSHFIGLLL